MVNAGLIGAIFMLIYSIVFLVSSFTLPYMAKFTGGPGPGFFPVWINAILLVVSVLYIVEAVRKDVIRVKDIMPPKESHWRILSLLAGLAFFCLTADFLGFIVAGSVLLFLMFIWDYKWPSALALSIIFIVILWLTFSKGLKVFLPTNALGF